MTMKEALYQIRDTLEGITLPIREARAIAEISAAAGLTLACIQTMEAADEQQEANLAEADAANAEPVAHEAIDTVKE